MSARQRKGVVKAMKAMTHVLQPKADLTRVTSPSIPLTSDFWWYKVEAH